MNSQPVRCLGYSAWPKHLSERAISEIKNGSCSEKCNEILTEKIPQNTFVLVAAVEVKRKFGICMSVLHKLFVSD
jgi:hypothetical protein